MLAYLKWWESMQDHSSVYERISETNKLATSSRSRIIVVLLSFITPVGLHNYYLGYTIKGIVQSAVVLSFVLFIPPFITVFALPIYVAWITSEGLTYLLWYDVKDGDGFRLYNRDKPPIPDKKKAILLAFLLPFGLHHFYLGHLKRGILEWGFAAIVLAIYLFYKIIPVLYISPNIILFVAVISWIEGIWMVIKK